VKKVEAVLRLNEATAKGLAKGKSELLVKTKHLLTGGEQAFERRNKKWERISKSHINKLVKTVLAEKGQNLDEDHEEIAAEKYAKKVEAALRHNEAFAKGTAKGKAELLVKTAAQLRHTVLLPRSVRV
jgi:hypothetical protein